MLDLIVAELESAFHGIAWGDDLSYFAYDSGKAGGIAAATGTEGVHTLSLCDDISEAYESIVAFDAHLDSLENHEVSDDDDDDFDEVVFGIQNRQSNVFYILENISERLESGQETEPYDSAPEIGWAEYGAALNEAVMAKESDDQLRYALMMGFVSGLMFNNPGPSDPEYGTILDAIATAYTENSDAALHYAQARIAAGVRMTDPTPFMGKEQYDRYMEERLRTLRWVQNFGLHRARAGDETVAVPGSMAINQAVRQMNAPEQAENPPRPIDHCYWVLPGKLLAGEYPRTLDEKSSREKLAKLTDAGVSAFIDLTEFNGRLADGHLEPYAHLLDGPSHQRFAIRDMSVPSSRELTRAALDAIDAHIAAGETVYVHCWGGVGRTGTIIGCWLARHHEPGQAALDRLKELWRDNPKSKQGRRSPETSEQERYVREWYESPLSAEQIRERDARIADESSANFADLSEDVKEWYRQVAIAQHKADQTGDYSDLIALGAWPEEEDEPGE